LKKEDNAKGLPIQLAVRWANSVQRALEINLPTAFSPEGPPPMLADIPQGKLPVVIHLYGF
jgi:hypothetical protein